MLTTHWIQSLRHQHEIDLQVYRAAHQALWNRRLHWVLIPVETGSFLLFCSTVLLQHFERKEKGTVDATIKTVCWSLGVMSLVIVDPSSTDIVIGVLSFLYHVTLGHWISSSSKLNCSSRTLLVAALAAWTLAWVLQVGVGHWIMEGNQPNVSNMNDVSWLAMTQSVLIAWRS